MTGFDSFEAVVTEALQAATSYDHPRSIVIAVLVAAVIRYREMLGIKSNEPE